jgi:DNA-binding IscR family transcriptional regulator
MVVEDVRKVFANDMATGGAEDVAHKKYIHCEMLAERCDTLLCMAQNGRFALSLRVLAVLAAEPEAMHTSAAIADELGESAVMVRRAFLRLHDGGFIMQRKGPNGGARLKVPAKEIGLGDLYAATVGEWLTLEDKALAPLLKRAKSDATAAMNGTTLAQVVKRLKKA